MMISRGGQTRSGRRMVRFAVLTAMAVALLAGCIPESNDGGVSTNSITVVNDTGRVVVWLRGPAGLTLDEALDRNVSISAIQPGEQLNRGLGERNANNQYCSPDQQWILAPQDPDAVGPTTLSRGFTSEDFIVCLLYTSPSPRDKRQSRMPSSA